MLYLKEANQEDIEKEYELITQLPEDENGFQTMAVPLKIFRIIFCRHT